MPQIIERSSSGQFQRATSPVEGTAQSPGNQSAQGVGVLPDQSGKSGGSAPTPDQVKTPDALRLEALARREQRLRRESQRIAESQGQSVELKKQVDQMRSENERYRSTFQRFLRDPVSVLNEAGIPGDVITQSLMQGGSREQVSIRQLAIQNQQLQKELKDLRDSFDNGQKQSLETTKAQLKADAKMLVEDESSGYDAIRAQGSDAVEAVSELIEKTYTETGRLMTVKEAAEEVENYLIEEAQKLAGIPKVREKLSAQLNPGGRQPTGRTQSGGIGTLSNHSLPAPMQRGRLSEKERVQRAIEAYNSVKSS